MKDTIDFIYAYQRAHEEQKGHGGGLSNLNESDEDAEMDQQTMDNARMREQQNASRQTDKRYPNGQEPLDAGRAGIRDPPRQKVRKPFELDLDNATLMRRRHRRVGQSPLAQEPTVNNGYAFDQYTTPGSPMQVG